MRSNGVLSVVRLTRKGGGNVEGELQYLGCLILDNVSGISML